MLAPYLRNNRCSPAFTPASEIPSRSATTNSSPSSAASWKVRAEYVKRYKARRPNSGEPELDPVLKFHLGLTGEER